MPAPEPIIFEQLPLSPAGEKARRQAGIAALLLGAAALIAAMVIALAVLWLILSTPKATGFDADGVRCYKAAQTMSCIKTAEPPR
jgi:hypothetical protein